MIGHHKAFTNLNVTLQGALVRFHTAASKEEGFSKFLVKPRRQKVAFSAINKASNIKTDNFSEEGLAANLLFSMFFVL